MLPEFSSTWTLLRIFKNSYISYSPRKNLTRNSAYVAKHFRLKSSASSDRMTPSGTGGGSWDWYSCKVLVMRWQAQQASIRASVVLVVQLFWKSLTVTDKGYSKKRSATRGCFIWLRPPRPTPPPPRLPKKEINHVFMHQQTPNMLQFTDFVVKEFARHHSQCWKRPQSFVLLSIGSTDVIC